MNDFNDLELNIMGCVLVEPKLMDKLIIEDKHFVKHQRTWQFLKSCYKKFGTLDIQLMYSICANKWHLIEYLEEVLDVNFDYWNFNKYQKQLIEQYNESKKEKWIKQQVYILATDFYVGNINYKQWTEQLYKIYNKADILFKEDVK